MIDYGPLRILEALCGKVRPQQPPGADNAISGLFSNNRLNTEVADTVLLTALTRGRTDHFIKKNSTTNQNTSRLSVTSYRTPIAIKQHFYPMAVKFDLSNLTYTVSQKNVPPFTCYNLYIHGSIATIFSTNVAEKVGNQNLLYFPTSPI